MRSGKSESGEPERPLLSANDATLFAQMPNGVAYCKMLFENGQPCDFVYLYTNPAFTSLTGLSEVIGKRVTEVIPDIRESNPLLLDLYGQVAMGRGAETFEVHIDSLGIWLSVSAYSPKPEHFVAVFNLITERKRAERELLVANERLSLAQRTAGAGVWDWDIVNEKISWSDEFVTLFGLDPAAVAEGASFEAWRNAVHPDDLQKAEDVIMACLRNHEPLFNQYRIILPTGEVRCIDAFGDTTFDDDGKPLRMTGICIDTTDRKRAKDQIEFLAHHDPLTLLPNRYLAKERLKMAMAYADRANENVALLYLDLDGFKEINDSLGHSMGDLLLVEVSRRLQDCLRETDTVSRQGGDEFLVILTNIQSLDAVTETATKIVAALAAPCEVEGHALGVAVSVGIAIYPNDARDADSLMQRADTAMYHAKGMGGNDYSFFNEEMNATVAAATAIRGELQQALAGSEFVLHYQPLIDLGSGRILGAEALLRWYSPKRGMMLPDEFIPVAEDCGLIVQIGDWVLQEACRQCVRWQQAGFPELTMAVNLSAIQFRRGDLQQSVVQALTASGLEPALLELELTESTLIREAESALATVRHLKSLGVRFAIDDFGTGYSSLAYLKHFPVDKLKIAQTFVKDMDANPEDAAIVHAIIQMARALDLRTVAEGIERNETAAHLRLYHCDEAQGNFYASPLSADEFSRYMLSAARTAPSPDRTLS